MSQFRVLYVEAHQRRFSKMTKHESGAGLQKHLSPQLPQNKASPECSLAPKSPPRNTRSTQGHAQPQEFSKVLAK